MKAIRISDSDLVLLKDEKTNELVLVDPNTDQEICLSQNIFLRFAHKIEFENLQIDLSSITLNSSVSSSSIASSSLSSYPHENFKIDFVNNSVIDINSEPFIKCNLWEENNP